MVIVNQRLLKLFECINSKKNKNGIDIIFKDDYI